ncbi:MAG: nucleotidyltransferase domain-containing protein [Spirochaetales bacterium]|nr:nucleotidyltransferase domain-containing protein [Spirochaetales bacterium]
MVIAFEDVKKNLLSFENKFKALGITRVGIFGSVARGSNSENSDVDILVELSDNSELTLFSLIGLEQELSAALNCKVDLVLRRDLREGLREPILAEVRYVS